MSGSYHSEQIAWKIGAIWNIVFIFRLMSLGKYILLAYIGYF